MYKKIILAMFLTLFISLSFLNFASAYTIEYESDPQNAMFFGSGSSGNVELIFVEGKQPKRIVRKIYNDSSYTSIFTESDNTATTLYQGIEIKCPGFYQFDFYDISNNKYVTLILTVTENDLSNIDSSCTFPTDSNETEPPDTTNPTDPPTQPEPDPNKDTDGDGIPDVDDEFPLDPDNGWTNDPDLQGYEACINKAEQTGNDWRYLKNPSTLSFECVLVSDCMYDTSQWFCNAEPYQPPDDDEGSIPNPPDDSTDRDCVELLCECISELKPILDSIVNELDDLNGVVTVIQQDVDKIYQELVDFHDEFETDLDFDITPMEDKTHLLDDLRPDLPTESFIDNNIYFKDEGDVPEEIGKLPKAPEPKDWEGVTRNSELIKDDSLNIESELQRESEKQKSFNLTQSKELKVEHFELDEFIKSPELEKQELQKSNILKQNHFYEQTNIFP